LNDGVQPMRTERQVMSKEQVEHSAATHCYAIEYGSRVLVYDYTDFIND